MPPSLISPRRPRHHRAAGAALEIGTEAIDQAQDWGTPHAGDGINASLLSWLRSRKASAPTVEQNTEPQHGLLGAFFECAERRVSESLQLDPNTSTHHPLANLR